MSPMGVPVEAVQLENPNPFRGCVPMCISKEIEAYGGDPPEEIGAISIIDKDTEYEIG